MAACAANLGKHPQVPVQRPIVARSLESLHLTGPTSASGHKTKPERATYRVERCCAIEHDPTRLGRRNEACSCLVLSTLTTTATARRLVPEKAHSNLEPRALLCRSLFPVQVCCTSSMPLSSSPTTTGEEAASVHHALISTRCTRVLFASHTRASSLYLSLATAQQGFFVPWPWACASSSATLYM